VVGRYFGPEPGLENGYISTRRWGLLFTLVYIPPRLAFPVYKVGKVGRRLVYLGGYLFSSTSEKAFWYLVQFSCRKNLESQFLVALATAMMFPSHLYSSTPVRLPLPTEAVEENESHPVNLLISDWTSMNEELPHYISLSCNPEVIISSLCGMFWDPNIPCNLVSS